MNCRRNLWTQALRLLRERGHGRSESGGFFLGHRTDTSRYIEAFLPYDDIDPKALRGMILFDGSRMDLVWERCRKLGLDVVADVHTHPGHYAQSGIDQANPMIPEIGHIALIVPNFADRLYLPGEVGMFEYQGRGGWIDHSKAGPRFFAVRRFA